VKAHIIECGGDCRGSKVYCGDHGLGVCWRKGGGALAYPRISFAGFYERTNVINGRIRSLFVQFVRWTYRRARLSVVFLQIQWTPARCSATGGVPTVQPHPSIPLS